MLSQPIPQQSPLSHESTNSDIKQSRLATTTHRLQQGEIKLYNKRPGVSQVFLQVAGIISAQTSVSAFHKSPTDSPLSCAALLGMETSNVPLPVPGTWREAPGLFQKKQVLMSTGSKSGADSSREQGRVTGEEQGRALWAGL